MDNLILSDKALNQQVCTECLNYLSVGPVVITCDRKIICGRCSDKHTGSKNLKTDSLYNLVAAKSVFQCISHYEGCKELLLFNEAIEHERNCKKNGFVCPFCNFKGNGCQLVSHFDKKHPEYVMNEDSFKLMLRENCLKHLVIVKESNIFCLSFLIRDATVEVLNLLITPANVGAKHFKLRFFKSDTNIEFVTGSIRITHELENFMCHSHENMIESNTNSQIQNSVTIDKASLMDCFPSGRCSCKIKLIDDNSNIKGNNLKSNYLEKINREMYATLCGEQVLEPSVALEFDAKNLNIDYLMAKSTEDFNRFVCTDLFLLQICVCCKKYITTDVYFCPKYHMACENCQNSKCTKCNKFSYWELKPDSLHILLSCEWNGCHSFPHILKYMLHKRDCRYRIFKCPSAECCFEGLLVNLKTHWHMSTLLNQQVQDFSSNSQNCNEIFFVSTEYIKCSDNLLVRVVEVDVVLPAMYKFRIQYNDVTGKSVTVSKMLTRGETVFYLEKYLYGCNMRVECLLR